jgi:DNA-binding NarL/FixJ family response regulator
MPRPRLVLVDDYEPAREMYGSLLEPEVDVVAAVSNAAQAQSAAETQRPDIMVLDIEMGTPNGFFVARWLKQHRPEIRIVFLTMHAERAYIDEAIKNRSRWLRNEAQCFRRPFTSCRNGFVGWDVLPHLGICPSD